MAGIILLVALVGVVAWVAAGDDVVQTVERADERFPSPDTAAVATSEAATPGSVAPVTTPPPTTPPPTPAPTPVATPAPRSPPTTPSSEPGPGSSTAPGSTAPPVNGPDITDLVPNIAAFAEPLATPDAVKAQIALLLAAPRHDVASDGGVSALCAVVELDGPIEVEGRWERDGHRVLATTLTRRDAPGYGECVGNDGDPLEDGSYQYIATDDDGAETAAGGFVVGAARIDQRFVNSGDEPICAIRIAPGSSRYFEAYVFDTDPVASKGEVTLPVAAVDQDVEATSCRGGDVISSFDFAPDAERVQDLVP